MELHAASRMSASSGIFALVCTVHASTSRRTARVEPEGWRNARQNATEHARTHELGSRSAYIHMCTVTVQSVYIHRVLTKAAPAQGLGCPRHMSVSVREGTRHPPTAFEAAWLHISVCHLMNRWARNGRPSSGSESHSPLGAPLYITISRFKEE